MQRFKQNTLQNRWVFLGVITLQVAGWSNPGVRQLVPRDNAHAALAGGDEDQLGAAADDAYLEGDDRAGGAGRRRRGGSEKGLGLEQAGVAAQMG